MHIHATTAIQLTITKALLVHKQDQIQEFIIVVNMAMSKSVLDAMMSIHKTTMENRKLKLLREESPLQASKRKSFSLRMKQLYNSLIFKGKDSH